MVFLPTLVAPAPFPALFFHHHAPQHLTHYCIVIDNSLLLFLSPLDSSRAEILCHPLLCPYCLGAQETSWCIGESSSFFRKTMIETNLISQKSDLKTRLLVLCHALSRHAIKHIWIDDIFYGLLWKRIIAMWKTKLGILFFFLTL